MTESFKNIWIYKAWQLRSVLTTIQKGKQPNTSCLSSTCREIFVCVLLTSNYIIFLMQFGINKHLWIFQRLQISPTSTSSNSPSGTTNKVVTYALDVEAMGKDTSQRNRKYDKWTNEEQKTLINLWADQHEQLESKDV